MTFLLWISHLQYDYSKKENYVSEYVNTYINTYITVAEGVN